ncbi:MAG TPA: hypothetical protein VJ869_05885 [Sphaerochaeta sp.]|nr:hypothetical protein [Sphaerochaeta sp.]
MNLRDTDARINMNQLAELYDALVSMLEGAPEHGTLTMAMYMRDGVLHRFETSRQESVFCKQGGQLCEDRMQRAIR